MSKKTVALLTIIISLLIDQIVKFLVKLNMTLDQEFAYIGNWAKIHFVENEGMAFGLTLGSDWFKLLLTLFRIVAVIGISYYLYQQIKKEQSKKVLIFCLALILSGAIGNIIDSIFYGAIFSESTFTQVATIFPESGGYGKLLHGKVVDMFSFSLYKGILPNWIPIKGGTYFEFFAYIFNVADACITVGVFALFLFQKKLLNE